MGNDTTRELQLEDARIRRIWHNNDWYYPIIDVMAYLLPENTNPANYWRVIKSRLNKEGASETLEYIVPLKMKSKDGRLRLTDTANRQTIFRLLQSIPSPRVEPFKMWLAQVGDERIEEIEHPETALDRVRATYKARGYEDAWIEERIKNDIIRNTLTDEWRDRGAQDGTEFAILTNTIHNGTFDISIQAHKKYKLLPGKTNLRDHMTHLELALTSLSEATAITLHQDRESQGFSELKRDTIDAGEIGGDARKMIEHRIGKPVVSSQNFLNAPEDQPGQFKQPLLLDDLHED